MTKISKADVDFLLRVLDLPNDLRNKLESIIRGDRSQLEEDEVDHLRDICGERLQTHGFGVDYEPTEEGKRLEDLIDKLFIG